jgi:hypothetical protein
MQNKNFIYKTFIAAAFCIFLAMGYVATNVATSCPAEAQTCNCSTCVFAGPTSVSGVLYIIMGQLVGISIPIVTGLIIANMTIAAVAFGEVVAKKAYDVADRITSWIDTFWYYNLLPALQAMTAQLSTQTTDQERAVVNYTDAADMNRRQIELEQQTIEDHREERPSEDVCVAASVTGGVTKAYNIQRAYSAAAPFEQIGRSGNDKAAASSGGVAADMSDRWRNYVTNYCRQSYNAGHSGCTADQALVNRDLDVAGEIFAKDTIDVRDATTKKVIDDIIINIAEPFTKDSVQRGAVAGGIGQEAYLNGESHKAKRQTIYDLLYHVVARRIPGSGMQDYIEPIRQEAGINAGLISDNPSRNEIMQVMTSERFRTGKYALQQIDEPENNQREMVIEQSFQVMQMADQLDLMDRYTL